MSEFRDELESLLNKNSKDAASDTPDYILARYIEGCLVVYGMAVRERDRWFGFIPGNHPPT